jgi:hypothetical protein
MTRITWILADFLSAEIRVFRVQSRLMPHIILEASCSKTSAVLDNKQDRFTMT